MIQLKLADFLPRIPDSYLQSGSHDATAVLEFEAEAIGESIAKGRTTIPLAEIYQRLPGVFKKEIARGDSIEIRFPWERILALTKGADTSAEGALSPAVAELLGGKLRSFRITTPTAPSTLAASEAPLRGDAKSANPWYTRKDRMASASPLFAAPEGALVPIGGAPAPEVEPPRIEAAAPVQKPVVEVPSSSPKPVLEVVRPASVSPARNGTPPPTAPVAEPARASSAAREEAAAWRKQIEKELEQCQRQQEAQLAALKGGREALREQLDETLDKLQRARHEIEEKTREFEARAAGSRDTTQSLRDAQDVHSLEVEKLLAAGELRINATEQERAILLQLRDHLQEMFKQTCFARNDFAKVSAELQLKTREFGVLEELAQSAEQQLSERTAERDALVIECAAWKNECGEVEPLKEAKAALDAEIADYKRQLEESKNRETELAAALASEQTSRQRAEERSAQAQAEGEKTFAAMRHEAENAQREREATFQQEKASLAARIEELHKDGADCAAERLGLSAELAELRTRANLAESAADQCARTNVNLQAAVSHHGEQIKRLRAQEKASIHDKSQLAASLARQPGGGRNGAESCGIPHFPRGGGSEVLASRYPTVERFISAEIRTLTETRSRRKR